MSAATVTLADPAKVVMSRRFAASRAPVVNAHAEPAPRTRCLLGPPGGQMTTRENVLQTGMTEGMEMSWAQLDALTPDLA